MFITFLQLIFLMILPKMHDTSNELKIPFKIVEGNTEIISNYIQNDIKETRDNILQTKKENFSFWKSPTFEEEEEKNITQYQIVHNTGKQNNKICENLEETFTFGEFQNQFEIIFGKNVITFLILDQLIIEKEELIEDIKTSLNILQLSRSGVIKTTEGKFYMIKIHTQIIQNLCIVVMNEKEPEEGYLSINQHNLNILWINQTTTEELVFDNTHQDNPIIIENMISLYKISKKNEHKKLFPKQQISYKDLFTLINKNETKNFLTEKDFESLNIHSYRETCCTIV